MQMGYFLSSVLCLCFVVSSRAAPLSKPSGDDIADLLKLTQNQENELKQLLPSRVDNSHSRSVVHTESKVVTNVNGVRHGEESHEHLVKNDGKLVSDVKQTAHIMNDEEGKPHEVVETEVDVPGRNIHEDFVNDAENEEIQNEELAALREAYDEMLAEELMADFGGLSSDLSDTADKRSYDEEPVEEMAPFDYYPSDIRYPQDLNNEQVNSIYTLFADRDADQSVTQYIMQWLIRSSQEGDRTADIIISNIVNIYSDMEEEEYVQGQLEQFIQNSYMNSLGENSQSEKFEDSNSQDAPSLPEKSSLEEETEVQNQEQSPEKTKLETESDLQNTESTEEKTEAMDKKSSNVAKS